MSNENRSKYADKVSILSVILIVLSAATESFFPDKDYPGLSKLVTIIFLSSSLIFLAYIIYMHKKLLAYWKRVICAYRFIISIPSDEGYLKSSIKEIQASINEIKLNIAFRKYEFSKKRIVIMLPLGFTDYHYSAEVKNGLYGIAKGLNALQKNIGDKVDNVDIVLRNHNNSPESARRVIMEELLLGCRHFICTMSSVCSVLTNDINSQYHFNNILKNFDEQNQIGNETPPPPTNAVLVCTIATSQEVKTSSNNIFRIFIEGKREADTIAKEVCSWIKDGIPCIVNGSVERIKKSGSLKICAIYTDDSRHKYSQEAGISFETAIKNCGINIHTIKIKDHARLEHQIKSNANEIKAADVLFVVAYFDLNERIIKEYLSIIPKNSQKKRILITPTVFPKVYFEKDPFFKGDSDIRTEILNNLNISWYISRPKKTKEGIEERFYGEISEFCMNISLQKLVSIITDENYTDVSQFSRNWIKVGEKLLENFHFDYTGKNERDPLITTVLHPLHHITQAKA